MEDVYSFVEDYNRETAGGVTKNNLMQSSVPRMVITVTATRNKKKKSSSARTHGSLHGALETAFTA